MAAMLIRNAEIWGRDLADVRIRAGRIATIGTLEPVEGENIYDAAGGALLPGLHDHHIHMAASAVARLSVNCGPPNVTDAAALAQALARPGTDWLRGIGYHESVAGMLDARQLDRLAPERPVRIQHRSGRMWFFNSMGMELVLQNAAPPPGMERENGRYTGRLFDEDRWLRDTLQGTPPSFASISAELARTGITGVTDMSPANDAVIAAHFASQRASGDFPQRVALAGKIELGTTPMPDGIGIGPAKLHLHENALPDWEQTIRFMHTAHQQGRAVAIHCTTETELVFALAALREAGPRPGDRIEHAGIAPDQLIDDMAQMDLRVVTQPHFIAERGDQYLRDVEQHDHPCLYRLGALQRAGLTTAAGSDAPYGSTDPWVAMRAAVSRRTASGIVVGHDEQLSPEAALSLYLADPHDLTKVRAVEEGAPADLCLLDRPWSEARARLSCDDVRMTIIGGSVVYDRIDQAPVQSRPGADPLA